MPASRLLPDDIPAQLETMVSLMIRVLFIELSAFHTFAWAESWLSDDDLVGGEGEAARLVAYIRADETPHVDYLRTALTELRDRTWIGESGRTYAGAELLPRLWDPLLTHSLTTGRDESRRAALGEVEFWCAKRRRRRRAPRGVPIARCRMKFGVFYEHHYPARGRMTTDVPPDCRTRSSRSSWPTASASTWCGRSSTTSLEDYGHPRRPRSSSARVQPADRGHRARSRDHPDRPGLQPPDPSAERGGPRSAVGCPVGSRTVASGSAARARGFRRSGDQEADSASCRSRCAA